MVFDRYTELSTKCNKSFLTRGCYVSIIGILIEEAIKKYIKEQQEESKKQIKIMNSALIEL